MQTLTLILFLSSFLVSTFLVLQAETIPKSFFELRRMTKLHFYLKASRSVNGTHRLVAKSNISDVLSSEFGKVYVGDAPITYDLEIKSREIGLLQDVIVFSNFQVSSLSVLKNIVFTHGKYKGSTLSIVGRNPFLNKVREFPIVGGTCAFRMASGYLIERTYFIDEAKMHVVFEYNGVVFHMG